MTPERHLTPVRPETTAQLRFEFGAVWFGDQPRELLADDLIGGVAKETSGGGVIGPDHKPLVDRDDAVRDIVEDRPDAVPTLAQLLFGASPFDELADLAADPGHHSKGASIEGPNFGTEERDNAGDLAPVGHGEGELGVQAGLRGGGSARRVAVTREIADRTGAARRPHPARQAHPSGKRQRATGLLVEGEILSRPVPIVFPPENIRIVVDDPEFADGPAKGLADSLQHLRRRLRPAAGTGERASHGELDVAQPLGDPPLADVVDEGDERHLRAGPRGGRDRDLDRELMAISVDRRQLHGLADDSSLSPLDEATESAEVRVVIPPRDDGSGQRTAEGLVM